MRMVEGILTKVRELLAALEMDSDVNKVTV